MIVSDKQELLPAVAKRPMIDELPSCSYLSMQEQQLEQILKNQEKIMEAQQEQNKMIYNTIKQQQQMAMKIDAVDKKVRARYARLEHGSVDMTLSKLKPIHANWVLGALDSIANNMDIARGWDRTGI
ncbi:hypothetical protein Bbelb_162170 [Branchiostoma belcheri]|nr:hypothetical protein Bbelb_162170 [Branchiostoma belcheri]